MQSRFGESRLIARVATEMQFGALVDTNVMLRVWDAAHPVTIDRIVFFLVVLCETARSGGTPADVGERDGVSINAAAASLGRSFETSRRHINGLIAAGLCERADRGVRVCRDVQDSAVMRAFASKLHDRLVQLVSDLTRLGVAMPTIRPEARYDAADGMRIALGLALSPFEVNGAAVASWNEMVILNAVVCANVRGVTFDPALARHHAAADAAPPDTLRVPVTAADVARALNLPYPTVRRHIEALVAAGLAEGRDGGYVVVQATVETDVFVHMGLVSARNAMTAVERLARCGFDVANPERHRLGPVPEPISFA